MTVYWAALVMPLQSPLPTRPVPLFLSSVAGEEDPGASVSAPAVAAPAPPVDSGIQDPSQTGLATISQNTTSATNAGTPSAVHQRK